MRRRAILKKSKALFLKRAKRYSRLALKSGEYTEYTILTTFLKSRQSNSGPAFTVERGDTEHAAFADRTYSPSKQDKLCQLFF